MSEPQTVAQPAPPRGRMLPAVLIGVAGSAVLWVLAPLNTVLLGNEDISLGYLPVGAVFILLVLVLAVNPMLRRLAPGRVLHTPQLAVIFGILLLACVAPSTFVQMLPKSLAKTCIRVSQNPTLAKDYAAVEPPPSLFPDRLGFNADTPASTGLFNPLTSNEAVPWTAWFAPLLSWGGFLVPWVLMMIGLALIVLPQWRDNERLAFPLLTVQQSLIEEPELGRALPPLFRSRIFWAAVLVVFGLRSLTAINEYFPGRIPTITLAYNLYDCFKDGPFIFAPWWVQLCPINFIFIGLAFFVPTRIGFSIWFYQILYTLFVVARSVYIKPFEYAGEMTDQSNGAFIVLPLFVLWLGRSQWLAVFRSLTGKAETEAARRNRAAGILFLLGCAGMTGWLCWAGMLPWWAIGIVALSVLYAVAITRLVAEAGVPMATTEALHTMAPAQAMPLGWRNAPSMYFSGVVAVFNSLGNQVCVMAAALHALALDRNAPPRRLTRLALGFAAMCAAALVVAGAVYLFACYHKPVAIASDTKLASDTQGGQPDWVAQGPEKMTTLWRNEERERPAWNRAAHVAFGAGFTALLLWLCTLSPKWPLHPIALLLGGMSVTYLLWFNVFIGWLCKTVLLRYGGSQTYSKARPFFIGLVLGEVLTIAFWGGLAAVLGALGLPYKPFLFWHPG